MHTYDSGEGSKTGEGDLNEILEARGLVVTHTISPYFMGRSDIFLRV